MTKKNIFLETKDHSVSGEKFQLIRNTEYGFLETNPSPSSEKLSEYYDTEDYISHTDSQRNLLEFFYHRTRNFLLKKKIKLINSFVSSEKTLLDIGCGTGDFLKKAQENQWRVTGIEPHEQARKIANTKTNQRVFDTIALTNLSESTFDVITLWHVLEHLEHLETHLAKIASMLKSTGTAMIAVPNYKSYDAKHYKSFWAAYDVPRHLWHFDRESLAKLLAKHNLQIVEIRNMWFDAVYVSLLSEKYKTGKSRFLKGFFMGVLSNLSALRTKETSSLLYIVKKR